MDIKQLNYFVVIAEEGNISAAAKKLHISQPPLSFQLKSLETELGVRLMERGARKITLTEAGKNLYTRAKKIIDLANTTKKDLEDMGYGVKSVLKLGTISTSGAALLGKNMLAFQKENPNIYFDIYEGNAYEMIEMVTEGVIEIAVVRSPFNTEGFQSIVFECERMVAVGTKDFLGGIEKEEIGLSDIEQFPLIIYRRAESLILAEFFKNGLKPKVFCKNDDAKTGLLWARAGMGVAIVPQMVYKNYFKGSELICKVISTEALSTQAMFIWKKDYNLSSAANIFIESFKK